MGGVTPDISHTKVAGPLGQVCGLLTHMCTCHMPGWEPPCCALAGLGLSGQVGRFPFHPGIPPVGSGPDTDPQGDRG